MTVALDPSSAVGYLSLLSCDLRTVGVRDGSGELLAGEPPDATLGTVVSRSSELVTIDVTVGPHGLSGLLQYDLETVLAELSR